MARDYAKQPRHNPGNKGRGSRNASPASRRNTAAPAPSPGIPGWVWMIMGLSIGLVIAAIVYIGRSPEKLKLGSAPAVAGANATQAVAGGDTKAEPARKAIALPPKQPSRFAFYEMLPSYEVVIPRESARAAAASQPPKPATAPASAPAPTAVPASVPPDVRQALAEPGQYVIQVSAYRSREEADKHRATLALIGVESRIEQVTIDEKDTWYRVRSGPYATLAKAQEMLDRLESNDIKGMLVKVKS